LILEQNVRAEINDLYRKLSGEGRMLSRGQLGEYYDTFRRRFAPEVIQNLDGESLLESLLDLGNRDSLAYWLEFKDDEELPARFGSISGGSALKYGIYRRKETGQWITGSPRNQEAISVEEAIEYARKYKEQMIRGAELLERLPGNASDGHYERLQKEMDRVAPDVSNSAWGHKYFSMLYPEKLDAFHVVDYQHFHLIKLLLLPPELDGRYVAAGRFTSIVREFNIHMNNLTYVLNERHGRLYRYWRIGLSDSERSKTNWDAMRDGGYVAIGWSELGDLSSYAGRRQARDRINSLMEETYPADSQQVNRESLEVYRFITVMAEGDLVLVSDRDKVLGMGRITGDYRFESSSAFPHCRSVEWLSLEQWDILEKERVQAVVCQVKSPRNLVGIERRILGAKPIEILPSADRVMPKFYFQGIAGRIQSVLERKSQVILYGPPGTGKTYWAEKAARDLASQSAFSRVYEELSPSQKTLIDGDSRYNLGHVRMCCFHPAYGYEDFLEGYRPQTEDGQMTFALCDGIFKRLCKDALERPNVDFYLIIDEINRGDIPRVFGELLTILEEDKRGKAVILPLSGELLAIPKNVYIIGTMNTADRSIALLDTALRRRFGFVELMPDSSVLGNTVVEGIPLGPWLDALNQRICQYAGRDARNMQIGHSYLLRDGEPVEKLSTFVKILREDIIPLLQEYCYDDYSALAKILGTGLVDEKSQRIRDKLFESGKQQKLVQALLAPSPEIASSLQAVVSEMESEAEDDDEQERNYGLEGETDERG
jgi:5-methylcytosine-specific restriction protein B